MYLGPFFSGQEVPMDSKWGWVIVAASFLMQVLILGFLYSFSVFYKTFITEFDASGSTIAAVGSVLQACMFATGVFVGPGCDLIGFRRMAMNGVLPVFLGLLISSFSENIAMLFVFFGIFIGVGSGIIYLPCISIVSTYFQKQRSFAVGIAVAGSGVGNAAAGPLAGALISSLGWRNALRTLSAIWCFLLLIVTSCMRMRAPRPQNSHRNPYRPFNAALFRDPVFRLFGAGFCVASAGYFCPFSFILAYAEMEGGFTDDDSTSLLAVIGVSSTVGRVVFGKLGDLACITRLSLMILAILAIGAITMVLPAMIQIRGLVYFYVAFFGLFAGAFIAMQPVLAAEYWGLATLGQTMGNLMGWFVVGVLLGPPLFGVLFDHTGSYKYVFVGSGACLVAGALIMMFIPAALRKRKLAELPAFAKGMTFSPASVAPLSPSTTTTAISLPPMTTIVTTANTTTAGITSTTTTTISQHDGVGGGRQMQIITPIITTPGTDSFPPQLHLRNPPSGFEDGASREMDGVNDSSSSGDNNSEKAGGEVIERIANVVHPPPVAFLPALPSLRE